MRRYRFRSVFARFLAGIFVVAILGVTALAIDHDRYLSRLLEALALAEFSNDALNASDDITERVGWATRECTLLADGARHVDEAARALQEGSGVLALLALGPDGRVVRVARGAACPAGAQFPRAFPLPGEDPVVRRAVLGGATPRITLAVIAPSPVSSDGPALVAVLDPDVIFASVLSAPVSAGRETALFTGTGEPVAAAAQAPRSVAQLWSRIQSQANAHDIVSSTTIELPLAGESWVVGVSMPRSQVLVNIADLRRHTLLVLALISAGGLLLSIVLARQITGPLLRLRRGAERVTHGDLTTDLAVDARDEVGDVARALQAMTHSLRTSLEDLDMERRTLEVRVQERTAALQKQGEELERANAQLRSLDRLKSDFITNVSHELRTPLTMVSSALDVLHAGDSLDDEQRVQMLSIAHDGATRLGAILQQILAYAEVDAGAEAWPMEVFDVRAVADYVVSGAREDAAARGLSLTARLHDDVPPVYGSEDKLALALGNLVTNALTFTPGGGEVEVIVDAKGDAVRIVVRDTGHGIAPEEIPHLFERFAQGGSILTAKPQGVGLGLPIARRVVEQHGGTIHVMSCVGAGSTFTIILPGADSMAAAA